MSEKDIASYNIYKSLKEKLSLKNRYEKIFNDSCIILLDKKLTDETISFEKHPEFVAILYRHASRSGERCFTVHTTGDVANNKLSRCNPIYMKEFLREISRIAYESGVNYKISIEGTHHGPIVDFPIFFVEIGSDEKAWKDERAIDVISEAAINILKKNVKKYKNAIAIGSNHYSEKFTRIQLNDEYAIGHFFPKYYLEYLNEDLIMNALEKSNAEIILADKKLKGKYKDILREISKKHDIKVYFV